jgi:hypothetical protein
MKQVRMLAAVGAFAALAGGSAAASEGSARSQTLQFTSVTQSTVFDPAVSPSNPPKVGSRIIFRDVMYNRGLQFGKPNGARVGHAEGVCTLIHVPKPAAQCVITAHAPDGEIVVVGEGDPGGKLMRYAITGGVGAYANARGTVTSRAINEQKTIVVVKLA